MSENLTPGQVAMAVERAYRRPSAAIQITNPCGRPSPAWIAAIEASPESATRATAAEVSWDSVDEPRSSRRHHRLSRIVAWAIGKLTNRQPDFVIGGGDPYLMRWWVIPRNRFFNVYLHLFLRDDDDRAHHDHPWANVSILLQGKYIEHKIQAGGVHVQHRREAGSVVFRLPSAAHRISLIKGAPCWSLFMTGPVMREWGFHCRRGWVPWQEFTNPADGGATIGRGCGDRS